jgi:hypothetical protein
MSFIVTSGFWLEKSSDLYEYKQYKPNFNTQFIGESHSSFYSESSDGSVCIFSVCPKKEVF